MTFSHGKVAKLKLVAFPAVIASSSFPKSQLTVSRPNHPPASTKSPPKPHFFLSIQSPDESR